MPWRLSLPPEVPLRAAIVRTSFAVVAFSIFVQGLTLRPLLQAFGGYSEPAPIEEAQFAGKEPERTQVSQ